MPASALDEGGLPALLGWRLAQARVAAQRAFDAEVAEPLGLKPVELSMLELLRANPGIAPARLARALAVSRPQATQLLDRLEERGLARRRPSGTDGRGFEVHATAEGQRCARDAVARLQAAEAAVLAPLSGAERAMLLELLAKLAPPGR
jgi:DNA-binding MarR family transcriptional regulator